MITLSKGVLIAVEGIDGSGKSSLVKNLTALLHTDGFVARTTREPGATALGKQLRTLVQEKTVAVCPHAEFLLFAADRAQHMHEIVLPSLAENMIVISDRMKDSSLVYQGYGRGLDKELINTVNHWAMGEREPDLTLYVKVDLNTAAIRIIKRNEQLTSFEKEHTQFIQKLINGFDDIYKDKQNVRILDGTQDAETVAHTAYKELFTWIQQQALICP